MAEYIDRQQIIGELNHIIETYMSDDTFQCFFAAAVVTDILSNVVMCQPSDDVAPVRHGRWEKYKYATGVVRCSVCIDVYIDEEWITDGKWNYCPNCGARIDGGESDA